MSLSEVMAILLGCSLAGEVGLLRTQLQKILYFASQKGILEDSFGRGYYGPFSSKVANSAESLVSGDFLNETTEFFPEGIGHRYSRKQGVEKAIPEFKKNIPTKVIQELDKIVELCRNRSTSSLSIAAKVHYVLKKRNAPMNSVEITKQAEKLKWNISPDAVSEASKFLKELGLIE